VEQRPVSDRYPFDCFQGIPRPRAPSCQPGNPNPNGSTEKRTVSPQRIEIPRPPSRLTARLITAPPSHAWPTRSRRRLALTPHAHTATGAVLVRLFLRPSTYEPAPPVRSSPSTHPPHFKRISFLKRTPTQIPARAQRPTPIPATSKQQQAATEGKREGRWRDPWTRRRCPRRR
jgi:hypothetical protein